MPKTAERPGESRAFRFSPDFQSALTALLTTLLTTLVLLAALLLLLIVLVRIVHEVSCGLA
jgi:hypothetical protein